MSNSSTKKPLPLPAATESGTALDLPPEGFALYVLTLRATNKIDGVRLAQWLKDYLAAKASERERDNAVRAIQAFSGRLVAVATELSDSI